MISQKIVKMMKLTRNHIGRRESPHIHLTYTASRSKDFSYIITFQKVERVASLQLLYWLCRLPHPFFAVSETIHAILYPFPSHILAGYVFLTNWILLDWWFLGWNLCRIYSICTPTSPQFPDSSDRARNWQECHSQLSAYFVCNVQYNCDIVNTDTWNCDTGTVSHPLRNRRCTCDLLTLTWNLEWQQKAKKSIGKKLLLIFVKSR